MAKKKVYPRWIKVAWRFLRVFLAAFLITVGTNLQTLEDTTFSVLVTPALIAGVSALAKAVREYLASEDYKSLIHKLPL